MGDLKKKLNWQEKHDHFTIQPQTCTNCYSCKKENLRVLRGFGEIVARKGFMGAIFCECSTLRVGARAEALACGLTGSKPRGAASTFANTARGLYPSQCCSPMKYLGFWTWLIPYCPPQQVHFPYIIYGCPLSSSLSPAEKGRLDPPLEESPPNPVARGQDLSLPSHTPRLPCVAWGASQEGEYRN